MTEIKGIGKELKKFVMKETLRSKELEEAGKLLDQFYTLASTEEEYREGAAYVFALDNIAKNSGVYLIPRAECLYGGWYLAYYKCLKSLPEGVKDIQQIPFVLQKDINDLAIKVISYFSALSSEEEPILWVRYGSLQSLIESQLLFDKEKAQKINEKIRAKAEEIGEVSILLKEINTRGLAAEKAGNLEEAIEIFSEVERRFPDATDIPHARLDFANAINNRTKDRILLSDKIDIPDKKRELLESGIAGLLNAIGIYKTVPPSPPVKHFEGIINRLIMASFRIFNLYGFYHKGDAIKRKFEAKKTEEAINEIKEAARLMTEHKLGRIEEIGIIHKGIEEAQKIIAEQKMQ